MKKRKNTRAMSLLITLAFIVIITILVVGFAETVRLSRPAAASYLERVRADQYSKSGVETVIAILNQATADTNRNWISQPGQLITGDVQDDPGTPADERKTLTKIVPLHSGSAPATQPADKTLASPNINVVTFRDPAAHLITEQTNSVGGVVQMPLSWIYVRESGATETNASPAFIKNDPITGRYAYWADDESSKVNYNIAWGRTGNTNSEGHPTRIDLTALTNFTQQNADALRGFITNAAPAYNFFNTPLDARRIEKTSGGAGVATALAANKFDTTHFNSDPNTTFFNEPRIVLTTRPDRAGWTYSGGQWIGVNGKPWPDGRPFYLRVLKNEGTAVQPNVLSAGSLDPGRNSNLSAESVSETIDMMALASSPHPSYMQRADWPMVSAAASIQDKYYSAYPAPIRGSRLAQLAIDIIDYVRAKESQYDLVEPIRGQFNPSETDPKKKFTFDDKNSNSYMGLSRTPYVTEIGVWTGTATEAAPMPSDSSYLVQAQPGQIIYKFKWEFYLPRNYGISEVDLSKLYVLFGAKGAYFVSNQGYAAFKLDAPGAWYNPSNPGSGVLKAGEYAVYTHVQPVVVGSGTNSQIATTMPLPRPTSLSGFRLTLGLAKGSTNLDSAPLAAGSGVQIDSIPIDPEAVAENLVTTIETDDPRVNKHREDWIARTSGNTLGQVNSRWSVGKEASSVSPALAVGAPQRDTDSDGKISDASFQMPPPAGKIFTKANGSVVDNTKGQVMSAGELGFVHTGVEGCCIVKMNSVDYPAPPGIPWRTLRLQPNSNNTSVVPDWALIDLFTAPIAAPNQYNRYVYAPHDTSFGGRVNINSEAVPFDIARTTPLAAMLKNCTWDSDDLSKHLSGTTAAEIANHIVAKTLASGGKAYGSSRGYDSIGELVEIKGVADEGEKSEELFREIANLGTTRGNVFSVYTIGQSLKQLPNGKLNVLAEQRIQAMVERYSDSAGSIHFAPVYIRNLSP